MILRECNRCDWWSQTFISEAEAERAETAHRVRHHGEQVPAVQLSSVVGWFEAIEAAKVLAATGQDFTLADLPDIANHKTSKGKLAAEIHRLDVAHPCGYRPSTRKATRGSAVKVWNADRARCIECPAVVEVAR